MSANSKIEWTDHTFNPWMGCTKVSPACDHCYAEVSTPSRTLGVEWGAGQPRRLTSEANWKEPLRWNAQHEKFFAEHGRRQRVFCASLADVFDNEIDPQWRVNLFALIEQTPDLDWLLLTKRIGNVTKMVEQGQFFPSHWPNVWIGATICNQEEADRDIPKLLQVPAAVRFLSMEPLLGRVDLYRGGWSFLNALRPPSGNKLGWDRGLDWVIVGGESGPHARPMHPDWARSLRDQCAAAGVPFLFKQWGEWLPFNHFPYQEISIHRADVVDHAGIYVDGTSSDDSYRYPEEISAHLYKIGKKAAGRLLDGRAHDEFPRGEA
jgi:protein gp37